MKLLAAKLIIPFSIFILAGAEISAQQLEGRIYKSVEYGSGWIDLKKITDFKEGDTLIVRIIGTAKDVVVRLLPDGGDPNNPAGIVEGPRKVQVNSVVKVILDSDYNRIIQVSVHGRNAFGLMSESNGPAYLQSVVWKKSRSQN
ncbi:MAG: hypothetical protein WCF67_01895 [Chitinophagaceae bacterium]